MKKFKDWYKEVSGKEFPNAAIHDGNWFVERGLPLVVSCTCANALCSKVTMMPSMVIPTLCMASRRLWKSSPTAPITMISPRSSLMNFAIMC